MDHPHVWGDGVGYSGKKVVIVGSGATAVTLLPSIAEKAAHVTMLQRSPSYVYALPRHDAGTVFLKRWLPLRLASLIDWWRRMCLEFLFVQFLTRLPRAGRKFLHKGAAKLLPAGFPVDEHFNPSYPPFDQRLCLSPDGDFFQAFHQPNCELVTDVIETVTKSGIRLKSDREIEADMIITATGLYMILLNGNYPIVNGKRVNIGEQYVWRSCMIEGVPNACAIFGYTVGTWTPGADIRIKTAIQVMKYMKKTGATSARPAVDPAERAAMPKLSVLHNSSGYIVRARERLPLMTGKDPWYNGRSWAYDAWHFLFGSMTKGMQYTIPAGKKQS